MSRHLGTEAQVVLSSHPPPSLNSAYTVFRHFSPRGFGPHFLTSVGNSNNSYQVSYIYSRNICCCKNNYQHHWHDWWGLGPNRLKSSCARHSPYSTLNTSNLRHQRSHMDVELGDLPKTGEQIHYCVNGWLKTIHNPYRTKMMGLLASQLYIRATESPCARAGMEREKTYQGKRCLRWLTTKTVAYLFLSLSITTNLFQ